MTKYKRVTIGARFSQCMYCKKIQEFKVFEGEPADRDGEFEPDGICNHCSKEEQKAAEAEYEQQEEAYMSHIKILEERERNREFEENEFVDCYHEIELPF